MILDSIILLAFLVSLSSNTHKHAWRERRNRLCSTTPPSLLLLLTVECMQPGVISASIFFPCSWLVVVSNFRFVRSASIFFSWSFIVVLILFFFFCSWSAVVVVLILDLLFKLYQFYERYNFFAFIVVVWLILRLCFWDCILIMLEFVFLRSD